MRSNEQLVQETLLAQLSEYQHQQQQQLDELNPFTGAAKAAGAVSGAIKGAGQKVAGTANRATSAMGNAFKQGQTGAQKAVAGQDYKAPAAKPGSSKIMKGLQAVGRGVGAVGDLKSKVQGYDVAKGTELQQRALANNLSVAQQKQKEKDEKDAEAKAATPQAQAELKRKKDLEAHLGTTGAAATAANAAANTARATAQADNKAINKSIARQRAKGGISQGIKKITPTSVPGQSSKTAKTVAAKTSVKKSPQKQPAIGGVKPNDPKYAALAKAVAAAEKKQAQA